MEATDVQRMADSVLREYAVPLRVTAVSAKHQGWTIAFAGLFPGAPPVEVSLQCERLSAFHVRESLKRELALGDD